MRTFFFFLLTLNYAIAQTDSPSNPIGFTLIMGELRQYLQLSEGQMTTLGRNITDDTRWSDTKIRRIQEVRTEIAKETEQPTLDPMALGVRYAEIEAICRDMRDQNSMLRTRNQSVLTDSQKQRLAALDDVLKLMPVVLQAQDANLMGGAQYTRTDGPVIFDPLSSTAQLGSFLFPRSRECGIEQSGYFGFLTTSQKVQR